MGKSLIKQIMKRMKELIAIRPGHQTALHSHSAKSPKDGDISRWLALQIMWLVKSKLLWVAAALMLSTTASAVGMGRINVSSALGQPLKAEIELVAVSKTESSTLVARLAAPEAYKSAGLDYPYSNKFEFKLANRANGEPYLAASSVQAISDPFVTILVELTWSSGKLQREYTFLLDPPGYVPEQPAQPAVQVVAPVAQVVVPEVPAAGGEVAAESEVPPIAVEAASESEVPVVTGEIAAITAVPSAPVITTIKPAEVPRREAEPMPSSVAAGSITVVPNKEWLVVQRGDTMAEIAAQYKLANISLERMLVALYRANIDEFDAKNMNRIRAGKILRLPKLQDTEKVTQSEAKREIRAQAADWNVYRQKLASAASISRESQVTQQVATGKISSSVSDKAPVAKESAKEVLKLSKGAAPGDKVATGAGDTPVVSVQDTKNAEQEELIANEKAAKEEQIRTAMLEKNLQDMQRLDQMKAEVAALTQQPPVETSSQVVIASPIAAVSTPAAASAVPAPVAKPQPVAASPEPSLVDQILGEPLYLAGGAGALLIIGGLGYALKRRKKKSYESGDEIESEDFFGDADSKSGHMTEPVMPSPETGDFTRQPGAKLQAAAETDNVDPISEADLFLNFGRDAQAEEILKEAIKTTPKNHQIHLKLLGIYVNRKDAKSFSEIALELKDAGDEYAWQETIKMGRELDPDNPLYGGAGGSGNTGTRQAMASDVAPAQPAANVDFEFDLGALSGKATPSPEQDFLSGANKTVAMSPGDMAAVQQPSTMDFDITASAHGADEPAAPNLDELIFDVTSSQSATREAQKAPEKPTKADDGVMEFTMDFSIKEVAEKPAPADEGGLAGISLDLDEAPVLGGSPVASASPAGGRDEHWQEVATKLDLAKAYQEMGDADGVREILAEVLNEGDAEQQETAKVMLKQLG